MNFEVFVQVNMWILFFWDMTLSLGTQILILELALCQWVGESKCWFKCPTA
jgi:hypothetical protein